MTLPSLEFAQNASPENAHLLVKKLSDAQTDIADCQEKNKRLSSAAEEASALLMEKEREASTLFARVKSLEAMPDPVLHDSVIEWLRMHRGEFNSVQFSKANRVSPQRAHEGLRALLESNAIIQVAGAYRENGTDKRSIFQEKKRGVGWFK
ncbi:MAG: hypothetical protein NT051_00145 [Candidatus Micrarchaeota archaeon]|nr:hypothetical protein [Candidatus Micrarchaeota archaeon]